MSQLLQAFVDPVTGVVQALAGTSPPDRITGGIPLEATGEVAVDLDGPIAKYNQGLPYTAEGRLAVSLDPVIRSSSGAAVFDANGRMSFAVDIGDHWLAQVPYTVVISVASSEGISEFGVSIVQNTLGECEYQYPATECVATANFTANERGATTGTYLWEIVPPVPGVSITSPTLKTTDVVSTAGADVTYNLRVTWTDDTLGPTDYTRTITNDHDQNIVAPTVDAGGPYNVNATEAVQLNGTVVDGTSPTTLLWTIDSGGTGTFSDDTIEDPTFTPDDAGAYVLRLTATPADSTPVFDTAVLTSNTAVDVRVTQIGDVRVTDILDRRITG